MCSRGDPPPAPPTPFRKRVSVPTLRTVVRNGLSSNRQYKTVSIMVLKPYIGSDIRSTRSLIILFIYGACIHLQRGHRTVSSNA